MKDERYHNKPLLRTGFAYLASVLMILMAFQVMAGGVNASETSESVILSDSSSSGGGNSTSETNETGPSSVTEEPPLVYDALPGGVKAYGVPVKPSVGELGGVEISPQLINMGDRILFLTTYGKYVVNSSHPESMALFDLDDRLLVRESYFSIELPDTEDVSIVPANGTIVNATADTLIVKYDLVSMDTSCATLGTMELETEFSRIAKPKITARLLEIAAEISEWQIVWLVFPSDVTRIITPATGDAGFPLHFHYEMFIPCANSSANFTVCSSAGASKFGEFMLDWSDENGGQLSATPAITLSGESAGALKVYFEAGKMEIDPYLVGTSSSDYPTDVSCQRKTFWCGGYYWAFYYDGSTIRYNRSIDGTKWPAGFTLPGGTQIFSGRGFDVACRNGKVAVAWIGAVGVSYYLFLSIGKVVGGLIEWSSRKQISTVTDLTPSPPSLAISTDGWYWLVVHHGLQSNIPAFKVVRTNGSFDELVLEDLNFNNANLVWFVIMPIANGNMALLETSLAPYPSGSMVRLRYWSGMWGPSKIYSVDTSGGMYSSDKRQAFSAVAESDGTIHLAYMNKTSYIAYSRYDPYGDGWSGGVIDASFAVTYPSISLDENQHVHVLFHAYVMNRYVIRHIERPASSIGQWTVPYTAFFSTSATSISGVSSWAFPIGYNAVMWTEATSPARVFFGNIPLPSGTSGPASEAWERDGLSPYGTYFSSYGDYVTPGSGLLTLRQTDVSVPGRNGIDLEVSRIYSHPRYFWRADGKPYKEPQFPYCNLGFGWGLDLPWMDSTYIYLGGGRRFVIQWGNNGNENEFENHDGTHFVLRKANRDAHGVRVTIYELMMPASGRLYIFWDDYKLNTMGDLRDYQPGESWYGKSYLQFDYDAAGRLGGICDDVGREVTFSYSSGRLSQITRPDGRKINLSYTQLPNSYNVLTSVSDPKGRVTNFNYESSQGTDYCILLKSIVFPTGAKLLYSYGKNDTVGTEVRSWLVTGVDVRNATNILIKQTNFTYFSVAGKVVFTNITECDENRVVRGRTEYVFQSNLKYMIVARKNASGAQMFKTVTWYDRCGQPVRIDTYKGASESISYTEYTGYDDFGNVIFSRDAMGGETYMSYANTNTQNSFQGGALLARTSTGKIFHDAFDDWDFSDWGKSLSPNVGKAAINGSADPMTAPALQIDRFSSSSGNALLYHGIGAQTSSFLVQTSFMTRTTTRSYILGTVGESSIRLYFYASGGYFGWYDGSDHSITNATCKSNVWYDVGFRVHYPELNKYVIYINGTNRATGNLMLSGNIDTIRLQAGYSGSSATTIWVDNIRVYKSLYVIISNGSGYLCELRDSQGELIDGSKTGSLSIPPLRRDFPPGYISVSEAGFFAFVTPIMDIWGGDVYALSEGNRTEPVTKRFTGFGRNINNVANDAYPSGSTPHNYHDASNVWVNDGDSAVSGSSYHQSQYYSGSHYHGFEGGTNWIVQSSEALVQYIWLEEGQIPQEIMVQYQCWNVSTWEWYRAYWGGNFTGADIIEMENIDLVPKKSHRVDDVPQMTGRWLQLTVRVDKLEMPSNFVTGVIWGLYCGSAKWDFTSRASLFVKVKDLEYGMTVKLTLPSRIVSATGGYFVELDLYDNGAGVICYPVSGSFSIFRGSSLVYEGPTIDEIFNWDEYSFEYSYSTPAFYANEVRDELKGVLVGTLTWQDYGKKVPQHSYFKRSYEGDAIEAKSNLGSSWTVSSAGYDSYGNQVWSRDPTGRRIFTDYKLGEGYAYPNATRECGWTEYFDSLNGWKNRTGLVYGLTARYTAANQYSFRYSLMLSVSGVDNTAYLTAKFFKDYKVNNLKSVSVQLCLDTFSHNNGSFNEVMDSGIKVRLFDSIGTNYANYTYWLACWEYNTPNNRTTTDPNIKVIFGTPPMKKWVQVMLYPSLDWNIDWNRCKNVTFELYVTLVGAPGDSFKIYYDDFSIDSVTTYTYDMNTGNLLIVKDPLGRKTNYSYDVLGRLVWTQYNDTTSTRIEYDDANNKVVMYDELRRKTVYNYDSMGRLAKVERWGKGTSNYSWEAYKYNWQDQAVWYRGAGGHIASTAYDCLGRATRITFPDNNYTAIAYDDMNSIVTYCSYNVTSGQATHKLQKVHDNLGRLNATREYSSLTRFNATLMTYDAVSNQLTARDNRSQVTRMSYDTLDRLTRNLYPDGYFDEATYDCAGRVTSKKDREANLTYSYYDAMGRLVWTESRSDDIHYKYDTSGQLIQVNNTLGTIDYTYDARGRMTQVSQVINSTTYVLRFGYDAVGNPRWVLYPNGVNVSYEYDDYDRARLVKKGDAALLQIWYNRDDTIYCELAENGNNDFNTTFAYNSRDWATSVVMKRGAQQKLSLGYRYDDVGNVVRVVTDTGTESYRYDWLNRLLSASGGSLPLISYTYNATGDRQAMIDGGRSTTYLHYPYGMLKRNGTWNYSYDRNGNLAHKVGTNASALHCWFNSMDQLTKATKENWNSNKQRWELAYTGYFFYDANGARAKTIEGSVITDYVFLGHDPWYEQSGTTLTEYVYVNGRLEAKLVGSDTYFYFSDTLGSVRQIWKAGATSAAFKVNTYKPFGVPVGVSGTDQKFKYAGEMRDATGLYYIYARYMDPELGRFTSLDPQLGSLSAPQSMNRYVYCVNNPLRLTDPTGTRAPGTDFLWSNCYVRRGLTLDQFMMLIGFIPIVGTAISTAYFAYQDYQRGDWGMLGFDLATAFPGGKFLKAGKFAKWFGRGASLADDLPPIHPTRPAGSLDDALRGGRTIDIPEEDFWRAYNAGEFGRMPVGLAKGQYAHRIIYGMSHGDLNVNAVLGQDALGRNVRPDFWLKGRIVEVKPFHPGSDPFVLYGQQALSYKQAHYLRFGSMPAFDFVYYRFI